MITLLITCPSDIFPEAALQKCSLGKGVLKICSKFTEEHPSCKIAAYIHDLFLRISLNGCFCIFFEISIHYPVLIWDKVLKNGLTKICEWQPLKNLTGWLQTFLKAISKKFYLVHSWFILFLYMMWSELPIDRLCLFALKCFILHISFHMETKSSPQYVWPAAFCSACCISPVMLPMSAMIAIANKMICKYKRFDKNWKNKK